MDSCFEIGHIYCVYKEEIHNNYKRNFRLSGKLDYANNIETIRYHSCSLQLFANFCKFSRVSHVHIFFFKTFFFFILLPLKNKHHFTLDNISKYGNITLKFAGRYFYLLVTIFSKKYGYFSSKIVERKNFVKIRFRLS